MKNEKSKPAAGPGRPRFSIRARIKSFQYAFEGLKAFFGEQHNALVHAAATGIVILLCVVVKLHGTELLFIVLVTGLVWIAELFNTAIEKLCDLVSPGFNPRVKFIKDVAAAAVLVSALVAVITAFIIFIPRLL